MKKKIIIAMIIIVVVLFFIKRKKAKENGSTSNKSKNQKGSKENIFPLKIGSKGQEVKFLQRYLNTIAPSIFDNLPINGVFDSAVEQKLFKTTNRREINKRFYNTIPKGVNIPEFFKNLF